MISHILKQTTFIKRLTEKNISIGLKIKQSLFIKKNDKYIKKFINELQENNNSREVLFYHLMGLIGLHK